MKHIRWLIGLALMAALLVWPEAALRGVQQAMAHWYYSVAPSLFPFMALMPLLTCPEAARAYEFLFGKGMHAALRLPGGAAPALVIGMVAGSPAGAAAARRIAFQTGMNQGQLQRLAISICGLSPAFLITGIGVSMLGSAGDGVLLLRAQIFAQLAVALLLRNAWKDRTQPVPAPGGSGEEAPVRAAVLSIITVCGYMALFGAFAQIIREIAGERIAGAMLCALDLPSGAQVVADASLDPSARLVILAGMTGFGGVCICMQNLSVLEGCGVTPWEFYGCRLLAATLCAAAMAAQLYVKWDVFAAIAPNPIAIAGIFAAILAIPVLIWLKKSIS